MNNLAHKQHNQLQRKRRVRSIVSGTALRPRLSVHISSRNITAQLIDDVAGKTIAYVTTVTKGVSSAGTMTEKATHVGTEIAQQAKKAKIVKVVFDRGGKIYHGRVAALADAARKEGLEF